MEWTPPQPPALLRGEPSLGMSRSSSDGGPPKAPRQRLSCAECRRLKLKCSRSWPCTSCVKRQCSELCPNDTMKSESRHARQKELTGLLERISSLEAALQTERSRNGSGPDLDSPRRVFANAPMPSHFGASLIETVGNLTLHQNQERSRFLGPGSASALLDNESSEGGEDFAASDEDAMSLSDFASGPFTTPSPRDFPFSSSGTIRISDMLPLLPTRDDLLQLGDLYYTQFVSFEPLQRDVWHRIHVPMVYRESMLNPFGERYANEIHPHRLALVFAIVACGSLNVSGSMPEAQSRAQNYLALAQQCLSGSRFISHPTIASVQTLLVMCQFFYALGRVESVWPTSGLALRLAQATGLHRDPASWSIGQPECDQRRALWQECLHLDSITALMLGRPCGISTRHQDALRPTGEGLRWDQPDNCDDERGQYHLARWRLTALIHRIVDSAFGVEQPSLETIMRLDADLRDFESSLTEAIRFRPLGSPEPSGPPQSLRAKMQRNHLALFTQEVRLFLHRAHYATALRESPDEPLRSPYAASVIAVLLEASAKLVVVARAAAPLYPQGVPFRRGIVPIFGAAVCQAALIIRSPGSLLVRGAWDELCAGIDVVEQASVDMNLAAALVPRLRRLQEQALRKLELFHTGTTSMPMSPSPTHRAVFAARLASPPSSSPPKFRSSPSQGEEEQYGEEADDEEEIRALGGNATLSFRAARTPTNRSRGRTSGPLGSPGLRPPMSPGTPTRSSIATLPIRPIVIDGIASAILDRIHALKPALLNELSSGQDAYLSIPNARSQVPPSFDFMPPISEAAYASGSGPFMFDVQSVYSAAFPPGPGHAPPGDIASLTSPLDPQTFWLEDPPAPQHYQPAFASHVAQLPPVTPRTVFDDLLAATIEPRSAPSFSTLRSPTPSRPWSPSHV